MHQIQIRLPSRLDILTTLTQAALTIVMDVENAGMTNATVTLAELDMIVHMKHVQFCAAGTAYMIADNANVSRVTRARSVLPRMTNVRSLTVMAMVNASWGSVSVRQGSRARTAVNSTVWSQTALATVSA